MLEPARLAVNVRLSSTTLHRRSRLDFIEFRQGPLKYPIEEPHSVENFPNRGRGS
jgi:hypothetical protein